MFSNGLMPNENMRHLSCHEPRQYIQFLYHLEKEGQHYFTIHSTEESFWYCWKVLMKSGLNKKLFENNHFKFQHLDKKSLYFVYYQIFACPIENIMKLYMLDSAKSFSYNSLLIPSYLSRLARISNRNWKTIKMINKWWIFIWGGVVGWVRPKHE